MRAVDRDLSGLDSGIGHSVVSIIPSIFQLPDPHLLEAVGLLPESTIVRSLTASNRNQTFHGTTLSIIISETKYSLGHNIKSVLSSALYG